MCPKDLWTDFLTYEWLGLDDFQKRFEYRHTQYKWLTYVHAPTPIVVAHPSAPTRLVQGWHRRASDECKRTGTQAPPRRP